MISVAKRYDGNVDFTCKIALNYQNDNPQDAFVCIIKPSNYY